MAYFLWAVALLIAGIAWLFLREWLDPDYEYNRAYREFTQDANRRGLTPKQRQKELMLRIELAKVRRLASKRAEITPGRAFDIIREEVDAAVERLSYSDKTAARQFKVASEEWLLSDLVYPDIQKLVHKTIRENVKTVPQLSAEDRSDRISAMRTPI